jgi:hypothetical protein
MLMDLETLLRQAWFTSTAKPNNVGEWDRSGTLFVDMRDVDAALKFIDLRDRSFKAEDVSLLTLLDRKKTKQL